MLSYIKEEIRKSIKESKYNKEDLKHFRKLNRVLFLVKYVAELMQDNKDENLSRFFLLYYRFTKRFGGIFQKTPFLKKNYKKFM